MHRSAVHHALLALALPAILAACDKSATTADAGASASTAAPAATTASASAGDRLAAAADAINPATSPREAVIAAMHKFVGVRSYHATMTFDGGPRGPMTNQLDFVAPDRFRMEIAGMGEQYVIGDTMYMSMHGRKMQVPMPKGTVTRWRDPASLAEAEAGMTVDDQGSDSVDGQSARKYVVHATQPKQTTTTLWIGDAGLPLQILANNAMGDATIKYSHFDDPAIVIEPPK
jgi:hypothetical protein